MKWSIVVFIFIGLLSSSLGGNILIFHLISTGSYVSVMNAMLQTLADHHTITLYSIVHDDYPHPNVTVVPMKVPPMKSFFSTGLFDMLCDTGVHYITWKTVMGVTEDHVHNIYKEKNFQKLLTTKPANYDVLMTFATFSEYSFQMAHVLNLPLIQICPTTPLNHVNDAVGNPTFMTTSPNMFSQEPHNSFYNRVKIYMKHLYAHVRYYWVYMAMINRITSQYLPPGTPHVEVAHRNTSVLFVNMNSAMGFARPFMPNMVEIGTIHCKPGQRLPQELEEFISGSGEHGIIYLSFGSSIRSKFPEYIKQAILRVFERLPQRVLWKWNEEMTGLPANVRVSKWFPQQDVLAHNKTRLFVTQGGMFSMQEGIYHGVPSLVIPIAFDQQTNCIMGKELGYSEYINFCEFTEGKFAYWINEMLSNPKYKFHAARVSNLTRDQPLTIPEKIRWWTDYVIRHRGNPVVDQLEDKSSGLTRMDVDVVLFLYTSAIIALIIASYAIAKILNFLKNQKYIVIKEKST